MTEKNKIQPKPTTAAEAPKRRTRSRKTALTLRQELLTELERMALGDEEAPRDKLKAITARTCTGRNGIWCFTVARGRGNPCLSARGI